MGAAVCLRRQKGLLQTALCLLALLCLGSAAFLYARLQRSEGLAAKFRQQQEALSGQLQVVYEHRSRLEHSLQKERGEHKKTKEDFLVYKLEAQEALNKEKQDSMNRYGALSSQHKILKNQHEDMKKQLLDMQVQHNSLKLENRKALEGHSQKYSVLQREKESDVANLQGAVSRLREENKLLRKAHQDVHLQLRTAQVQMEEFRQLKAALQKMPSFKDSGAAKGLPQLQLRAAEKKILQAGGPDAAQHPLGAGEQLDGVLQGGHEKLGINPPSWTSQSQQETRLPGGSFLGQQAQPPHAGQQLLPPKKEGSESRVGRFMRTVNSLPDENLDQKPPPTLQEKNSAENQAPAQAASTEKPLLQSPGSQQTGAKQVHLQSWQDIVNKVNDRIGEKQHDPLRSYSDQKEARKEETQQGADEEELEMDAGMIDREDHVHLKKEPAAQKPMMLEVAAADPAQDPNNQGEDEFEEAELERPDFEEKVGGAEKLEELLSRTGNEEAKSAAVQDQAGEEPADYEEDQEQGNEEQDGNMDDKDDLELIQGKEEY
ncbi:Golgi integral membrane protein 4-like [Rhinatrema bivittatum]|uniref:Golgi integral membrane protein 4-like n=1 Tax=Rhinatrema bivittatum TaxID=194408 RepID=UPI00112E4401|nr:Golgi integral membrane protein 4-like [Rhinatrema bivittatum]